MGKWVGTAGWPAYIEACIFQWCAGGLCCANWIDRLCEFQQRGRDAYPPAYAHGCTPSCNADLQVWSQDELDAARDRGDAAAVAALLCRRPGDARDLFEQAVRLAAGGGSNAAAGAADAATAGAEQQTNGNGQQAAAEGGAPPLANSSSLAAECASDNAGASHHSSSGGARQWYIFSYMSAFLARRAEFLASCAEAGLAAEAGEQQQPDAQQAQQAQSAKPPAQQAEGQQPAAEQQQQQSQQAGDQHPYWQQAVATYAEALQWAAQGGTVLAQYRFQPATGAFYDV